MNDSQTAAEALVTDVATALSVSDIILKGLMMLVMVWFMLEIGFFMVVQFILLPNGQKLTKAHPYHGDMIQMMKRCVDLVKQLHCYSFDKYLSGFCCGADFKDIHLENWRSFLAWAMYNKHLPELNERELEDLETCHQYAQQEHPVMRTMKPGFNPAASRIQASIEVVPVLPCVPATASTCWWRNTFSASHCGPLV